jgi:hypothetical protein
MNLASGGRPLLFMTPMGKPGWCDTCRSQERLFHCSRTGFIDRKRYCLSCASVVSEDWEGMQPSYNLCRFG